MNPWLGLSKELVYRPGDALEVEPPQRPHCAVEPPPRQFCTVESPRRPRFPAITNPWGLTGAQCAVMAHLVDGHNNKEISELLGIVEKTVELHLHNTRKAMGVNKTLMAALTWDRFHRPAIPHPAETAQPLAAIGDHHGNK